MKPEPQVCGILAVDKPAGPTSFQMVRVVRQRLGVKKVGHAGTLDPFASGLLLVCVGRPATRLAAVLMTGAKRYRAEIRLGVATTTFDPEGEVTAQGEVPMLDTAAVERCLAGFRGEILQQPPPFSALKHKGKPLYYYARRGEEVVKEPRPVTIYDLRLESLAADRLVIDVRCSKGTYIRSLAVDIGHALGCPAHLAALRRLASGRFTVDDAVDGGRLATLPREEILDHLVSIDDSRVGGETPPVIATQASHSLSV